MTCRIFVGNVQGENLGQDICLCHLHLLCLCLCDCRCFHFCWGMECHPIITCSECLCFSIFFVFVYANVSLLVFVIIIVIVFAFIFTGRMERRPIITCTASGRRSCAFASLAPVSRWPQINRISWPIFVFVINFFFLSLFWSCICNCLCLTVSHWPQNYLIRSCFQSRSEAAIQIFRIFTLK